MVDNNRALDYVEHTVLWVHWTPHNRPSSIIYPPSIENILSVMPLRIRDLESEEEDESKGEQKTKTTPLDSLYSSLLIKSQFL
jgi:hypothetical protein